MGIEQVGLAYVQKGQAWKKLPVIATNILALLMPLGVHYAARFMATRC